MDDRSLMALTAAVLVLSQLQAYLMPGLRVTADPLVVLARHEAERTAQLRRLGIEVVSDGRLAMDWRIALNPNGPHLLDAVER